MLFSEFYLESNQNNIFVRFVLWFETITQGDRTVVVGSPQTLNGHRKESVQCPHGVPRTEPLRSPYGRCTIFVSKLSYKKRAMTA